MSVRGRMTMRAVQRRDASPSEDAWGQDGVLDLKTINSNLPCWAWEDRVEHINSEEKRVFISTIRAMLPKNADVKGKDILSEIRGRSGDVVIEGDLRIENIRPTETFLDVTLERVDAC